MNFLPKSLVKVSWRFIRQHLWQSILMVVGIALGVAVVVGVDIANESAQRAFDLSAEAVAGRATHVITGGPQGIDENLYSQIRRASLGVDSAPVISDYVRSAQIGEITLQLLGVDPFAEPPFRNYLSGEGAAPVDDLVSFLTNPGAVLLSKDLADRYNLEVGDQIELEFAGNVYPGFVSGLLEPSDSFSRRALEGVVLADISTAQELTGRLGILDRIDLILPEPVLSNSKLLSERTAFRAGSFEGSRFWNILSVQNSNNESEWLMMVCISSGVKSGSIGTITAP